MLEERLLPPKASLMGAVGKDIDLCCRSLPVLDDEGISLVSLSSELKEAKETLDGLSTRSPSTLSSSSV
jgi:hypothetical protein